MLESYVVTHVKAPRENRWNDWPMILETARRYREYIASGGAIAALSYLGHTIHPTKDDALFCAACADHSGFLWCGLVQMNGWLTVGNNPGQDVVRLLYRRRLSAPLGEMENDGGCPGLRCQRRAGVAEMP